jgi:3-oxoadipate enol-lactonase
VTRHTTEVAGRKLSWLQSGEGSPLVLLHAFPLSAEMWAPQHANVPSGWQLITPDLRGFGFSSGPPATSVDDHADDVLALLRHLGLERVVIGGLSMGGYVTFALLRRAAQRVRGLVLAATRVEPDSDDARATRVEMQQMARARGASAIAEAMVPKLLGPSAVAGGEIPGRVRALIVANQAEGIIDALEALKTRPDSAPTLARVQCPALVIVGADDQLTPVSASETIARGISQARLTVIPESGHLSSLEAPRAFDAALHAFLGDLGDTSVS